MIYAAWVIGLFGVLLLFALPNPLLGIIAIVAALILQVLDSSNIESDSFS